MPNMLNHQKLGIEWTGNLGTGTSGFREYARLYRIFAEGKPDIPGTSDPAFSGDPTRWNPEELVLAAISACHKLWYLHFCAVSGVVVTEYVDHCEGTMRIRDGENGKIELVVLRPRVTIIRGDPEAARELHDLSHEKCFIANSMNFEIKVEPEIIGP